MKKHYVFLLMTLCITSCKKDDNTTDTAKVGGPPQSFDLLEVPLNATNVDLTPTLRWESAKNPSAGEVTYDLYLGTEPNPTTRIENDIDDTFFEITDRLNLLTNYYWKVVAKDVDGKTSQSNTHKFTTRYYQFQKESLVSSASFSERYGHATAVFNDKIWVIGGREGDNTNKNDVWNSSDGVNWTEVVQGSPFSKVWGHATVYFDNKIWVIGGNRSSAFSASTKSEVWYSSDGASWTAANLDAPFTARQGHTAITFDNKIWVFGGSGLGFTDDVWHSNDGINWTEALSNVPFLKRAGHTMTFFKNKLWIIGGSGGNFSGGVKKDVWYSSDGLNWEEATPAAQFSKRLNHTTVVFDNKLWVIGGRSQFVFNSDVKNDVWYSSDGVNWTDATTSTPFTKRWGHTSAVFKNTIWVIGGDDYDTPKNDLWVLD